ncbi:MAG: hypothetical protein ACRCZ2_06140 [Fusobacteriaceae bacterium]
MAKLKNIIVAHKAQMNQHVPGAIDVMGAFDNLMQPIFPFPMMNLSIVITLEEIEKPTKFEVRLNSPSDELITKGDFIPLMDPFGTGKKILDLEKILIKDRGLYTIDIFEKAEDGKVKFVAGEKLFIADYPPQRKFSPQIIADIIAKDNLIKMVKTEFRPLDNPEKSIKIQISLDKSIALEEGFMNMPEDDKVTVEGKDYDLTGLRRQVEWMFGNPIPKEEKTDEILEKVEE